MSTPTSDEKVLLRTQPHLTKLYLSIYKPDTLFTCQVTGTASKGDRVISYYNGSGGTSDLDIGLTVYVGTTPGGMDKGSIYLFAWDASTITVGENSHINWANNDYITIVNFYQIWPVYPRYVQSDTDITVYKAHDFAYTNQNEVGGTFICMGPHHAGFLSTGSASVYYTAANTHNIKGQNLSYVWEFEGGTPSYASGSAGDITTPGWVTYDTPGHYSTTLWAFGSDGTTDRSIRHVSIYDRPEEGTNVPILSWGLESLSGSRETGGYLARVWVEENLDDIVDGALVVIFADDYYGATKQSIGGNATNRDSIVFVGYIMDGSIERDYQRNRVSFEVGSPTEIMKIGEAFSISVQDSSNPIVDANNPDLGGDPWFYYVGLTVKRALHHYIRWHTSVFRCMDIEYDDEDFNIQYFDADRSSIYDAIQSLLKSAVFGNAVCDMQGKLWFEIEAEATNNATSSFGTCMFIDKHDWINQPSITEQQIPKYSFIEMGGVAYTGITGTYTPLLAAAPGQVPAYRGHNEKLSGLALTSQDQLNTLAGNVYAYRNAKYPNVRLDIAGNYRIFDIAPQEVVSLTMAASENHRGVSWVEKAFTIRSIDWVYDSRLGLLRPSLDLHEVTQGFTADTVTIPVEPPDDGFEDIPPPVPPPPVPPLPTPGGIGGTSVSFVPAYAGITSTGPVVRVIGGPEFNVHGRTEGVDIRDTVSGGYADATFRVPAGTSSVTITPLLVMEDTILKYATMANYVDGIDPATGDDGDFGLIEDIAVYKTLSDFVIATGLAVTVSVSYPEEIFIISTICYPPMTVSVLRVVGWLIS